jgi:PAS domain S-box-containing protein
VGVFVYRGDRVVFANSRFGEMMGYPPQEMVGKSIWGLFHEQDRLRVQDLVQKRKEAGFSDLHYECRLVRKDGQEVWADVASSVVDYEEEPSVLVNIYNITDKKKAEEKRGELLELARKQQDQLVHSTRLAELGEMAAAVAHELNQPLTGIRNFAKNTLYMMDNRAGSPEEIKENLRLISEQVDRAAKIINQMRQLARRSEREFALVDVNHILRESVAFLMPQFGLSGVQVAFDLAMDLPQVMGDRVRLEQVFLNLLTNAKQAMEESAERNLVVKTYFDKENGCPVVAQIADTGKGLTSEESRKLFTPFFSTKKPGHGTGLGLSISLSIVKDHKGRIDAVGSSGKGATFTVRLPLPKEEGAPTH